MQHVNKELSRRNFGKLLSFGLPAVSSGFLLPTRSFAQSAWSPGGVNSVITNGFLNNTGGIYTSLKQNGGNPYTQGGWTIACQAYMGLVQQLRTNGFDSISDSAFASPVTPSSSDVANYGNYLIGRGFDSSITGDIQNQVNITIGQEAATQQQISARGGYPACIMEFVAFFCTLWLRN